jgi:hypothetical protein
MTNEENEKIEDQGPVLIQAKNQYQAIVSGLLISKGLSESAIAYDLSEESARVIIERESGDTSVRDHMLLSFIAEAEAEIVKESKDLILDRARMNIQAEIDSIKRLLK